MGENGFIKMLDAAIKYFEPNSRKNDEEIKILELANETVKIESDRLQREIDIALSKIHQIETEIKILSGNHAFTIDEINKLKKENESKNKSLKELQEVYLAKKESLIRANKDLSSRRRIESYAKLAEKRTKK